MAKPATEKQLVIDPRLLQRLKGIELKSRYLVSGLYNNRHRTKDRGSSTEFVEHREYRRGDEIRSIDWRIYARTNRHFVKVHEMESNMRVNILLDSSDSMRVPPPKGLPGKLELASVIAGAVAMMVRSQQDSVGLFCLADGIAEHIPCRQGGRHLLTLYNHLATPPGRGGGNFSELVHESAKRMGTRAMALIITDGLDDPDRFGNALKILRVREQDVTVIQVLDRNEVEFPFEEMTEFQHPESNERIIGDPADLRESYLRRLDAHLASVKDACKKAQADFIRIHNGEDLIALLSLHFIRRQLMNS